jgi:hypothetical protein
MADLSGIDSNRPFINPHVQYNGPEYVAGTLNLAGQGAGTYFFNREGNLNYETFGSSLASYQGYITVPAGSVISDVTVYANPLFSGSLATAGFGLANIASLAITTGNLIGTVLGGTGLDTGAIPVADLNSGCQVRVGEDIVTANRVLACYVPTAVTQGKIHAVVSYYRKST